MFDNRMGKRWAIPVTRTYFAYPLGLLAACLAFSAVICWVPTLPGQPHDGTNLITLVTLIAVIAVLIGVVGIVLGKLLSGFEKAFKLLRTVLMGVGVVSFSILGELLLLLAIVWIAAGFALRALEDAALLLTTAHRSGMGYAQTLALPGHFLTHLLDANALYGRNAGRHVHGLIGVVLVALVVLIVIYGLLVRHEVIHWHGKKFMANPNTDRERLERAVRLDRTARKKIKVYHAHLHTPTSGPTGNLYHTKQRRY